MMALEYRHEVLRYLAARVTYRVHPRLWSARLAPLHLVSRPAPVPDRPGWIALRVLRAGICGTDLALATGQGSLALEPEASYPFVPGHEILGRLEPAAVGLEGTDFSAGDRVAIWPVLGCRVRGVALCPSCREGWDGLCERPAGGWPHPAASAIGFCHETSGGWAEQCLAHRSQLWRIPGNVPDEAAVLLDPAAAALAAVLRTDPWRSERTVVVGGGPIALLVALLHRALDLPGQIEVLTRHEPQAAWARSRGLEARALSGSAAFRTWAADRGFPGTKVAGYGHVFRGRCDRVIVAAATVSAFRWAVQAVRPGGTIALIAAPARLDGIDPTPLWYREVTICGIYQYGPVPWRGDQVHPFAVLLDLLGSGRLAIADLVTHTWALEQYGLAFNAMVHRGATGAIKVTFRPGPG